MFYMNPANVTRSRLRSLGKMRNPAMKFRANRISLHFLIFLSSFSVINIIVFQTNSKLTLCSFILLVVFNQNKIFKKKKKRQNVMECIVLGKKMTRALFLAKLCHDFPLKERKKKRDFAVFQTVRAHKIKKVIAHLGAGQQVLKTQPRAEPCSGSSSWHTCIFTFHLYSSYLHLHV